jgi:pyruvate/2-oxoglutarate dehydrogenase complex dihydrolipoamide acyltransferase (E2) component
MPKLGLTMEEATVVDWLAPDGAHVVVDQPLCEIETDKATQEILAEVDGVLRHVIPADTTVPAGAIIAHID